MEQKDIDILFKIAKYVNPMTHEAIQNYVDNECRISYLVQYKTKNKITAIWFDVLALNDRDLKFIFKTHHQSNKQFFIHYLGGFYRIGFKN